MINELNHRVKNTLSVLHSMVLQSFRTADPASKKVFEGRLTSLSAAHNVLTERFWKDAPITEVIESAMAAHCGNGNEVSSREGPNVLLAPPVALSISMAIHELCTNATKYGALSVPEGRIEVSWKVGDEPSRLLHIVWREVGGPPVTPPKRTGFGTRLIQRNFSNDPGASVNMDFKETGLVCSIILNDYSPKATEPLVV